MLSSVILCNFKCEKEVFLYNFTTNEGTFKEIISERDDAVLSGYCVLLHE